MEHSKLRKEPVRNTRSFGKTPLRSVAFRCCDRHREYVELWKKPLRNTRSFGKTPLRNIRSFGKTPLRNIRSFGKTPLRSVAFRCCDRHREYVELWKKPLRNIRSFGKTPLRNIRSFGKNRCGTLGALERLRYPTVSSHATGTLAVSATKCL